MNNDFHQCTATCPSGFRCVSIVEENYWRRYKGLLYRVCKDHSNTKAEFLPYIINMGFSDIPKSGPIVGDIHIDDQCYPEIYGDAHLKRPSSPLAWETNGYSTNDASLERVKKCKKDRGIQEENDFRLHGPIEIIEKQNVQGLLTKAFAGSDTYSKLGMVLLNQLDSAMGNVFGTDNVVLVLKGSTPLRYILEDIGMEDYPLLSEQLGNMEKYLRAADFDAATFVNDKLPNYTEIVEGVLKVSAGVFEGALYSTNSDEVEILALDGLTELLHDVIPEVREKVPDTMSIEHENVQPWVQNDNGDKTDEWIIYHDINARANVNGTHVEIFGEEVPEDGETIVFNGQKPYVKYSGGRIDRDLGHIVNASVCLVSRAKLHLGPYTATLDTSIMFTDQTFSHFALMRLLVPVRLERDGDKVYTKAEILDHSVSRHNDMSVSSGWFWHHFNARDRHRWTTRYKGVTISNLRYFFNDLRRMTYLGGRKNEKRMARIEMLTAVGTFVAIPVDPDLIDTDFAAKSLGILYPGGDPKTVMIKSIVTNVTKHWGLKMKPEDFKSTNITLLRLLDLIFGLKHKIDAGSESFASTMIARTKGFREFHDPAWHSHMRVMPKGIKTPNSKKVYGSCKPAPVLGEVLGENEDHLVFFDVLIGLANDIVDKFIEHAKFTHDKEFKKRIKRLSKLYKYI